MSSLKNFLIVLDIDNTLISVKSFVNSTDILELYNSNKLEYKLTIDPIIRECLKFDVKIDENNDNYQYAYNHTYIIPRPGLDIFLEYLFNNFTVALWTAGQKFWMDYVLDTVLKKYACKFLFKWSREHCVEGKYKEIKFISEIFPEFNLEHILLVDDNIRVTLDYVNNEYIPNYHLLIRQFIVHNDSELYLLILLIDDYINEEKNNLNIKKLVFIYNNY